ncbi:hypothetical protein TWF694_000665 [Orbilia ellipsospora]|uniref:holo-[acyl-carrier-protein] synthase n=1 Tax=Orbilia ellipsospora TaxID=2528407 RepID=A0AAV9XPA4_9PEZI
MPLIRWLLNVGPLWNTPDEFTQALNYLPPPTHQNILNYVRPADRKLALASQLLQHLIVSKHRNIPFSHVTIVKNFGGIRGGRPVFVGDRAAGIQGLEYNVSHHGTVVAITSRLEAPVESGGKEDKGGGIGVDVLQYEKRPGYVDGNLGAVMEWVDGFEVGEVFTKGEMNGARGAVVRGNGGEGKMREVVKAVHLNWTLKEAYVKAVGTGLVTDLTAVDFEVDGVCEVVDRGERSRGVKVWLGKGAGRRRGDEWYFEVERVQVGEGVEGSYCVAMATQAEGLGEEDKNGVWQWLNYEADMVPFIRS